MMFFPFRSIGLIALGIVSLGFVSWLGHELVSGSAAKAELETVRIAAIRSTEKAKKITDSNIRLNELQNNAVNQLNLSKNRIKTLQEQLKNANRSESECPENCRLSF